MAITINNPTMLGMLDVMHAAPASMDAQQRDLLTQVEKAGFRPSTYGPYKGVSGYDAVQQLSVIGLRLDGDITFALSVATEGAPIPEPLLKAYLQATDLPRITKVLHRHGDDTLGLLHQQPAQGVPSPAMKTPAASYGGVKMSRTLHVREARFGESHPARDCV